MFKYKVLEAPLDQNLSDFSLYLWQQGIAHRIYEQAGCQLLLVNEERHVDQVLRAYQQLEGGQLSLRRVSRNGATATDSASVFLLTLISAKATVVLIVLSILGAMLPYFDTYGEWIRLITFQDFHVEHGKPVFLDAQESFAAGEYWRLLTPVFLHFGWMHIVFNSLWLWELGRRIEGSQGSLRLLGLVLLIGVGSNIMQYRDHQDSLFGGMSGVIYGLLGYCWFWDKLCPDRKFQLPPGIIGFMLVWLMIGYSGFFEMFGVHIANAAHLYGLILGIIMGAGAGLFANQQAHKTPKSR